MNYTVQSLHPLRSIVRDVMNEASKRNNIHGFFELDITLLKQKITEHRKAGHVFSYSAYLMYCLGQTLRDNMEMLDMAHGRNKYVRFNQIDLFTVVERKVKGDKSIPVGLIIRDLGSKDLDEINQTLRHAQKANPLELESVKERRDLLKYPSWIRSWMIRRIHNRPNLFVKYFGNVGLSSLNFFTDQRVWYGLPLVAEPLFLLPSASFKKLVMIDGQVVERDFASFTISVNHDMNDGSPSVRFVKELAEKIEGAFGL